MVPHDRPQDHSYRHGRVLCVRGAADDPQLRGKHLFKGILCRYGLSWPVTDYFALVDSLANS